MPKYRKLFALASQLKAGKGLSVCVSVIKGEYTECVSEAANAKQCQQKIMEDEKVKGFVDIIVSNSIISGLSYA